jgi:predicted transposase YbfD/YdcC
MLVIEGAIITTDAIGCQREGAIQSDAAYAVDSRIEGLGIWRRRN